MSCFIDDLKVVVYQNQSIEDGEIDYLQSWGSTSTSSDPDDHWEQVLIAKGYNSKSEDVRDMQVEWLQTQTGLTTNNWWDLQCYAFENGLYTFAPVVALFDGNRGIEITGSGVSTWTDQINAYDVVQSTDSERPTYSAGVLTFDNSADQDLSGASINTNLNFTGDFTTVVVIQTSADFTSIGAGMVYDNGGITGSNEGIATLVNGTDNKFRFFLRDSLGTSAIDSNDVINDGDVHVILCQSVSGTQSMYVDGILQTDTDATAIDVSGSTQNFTIGNRVNLPALCFDGNIMQQQFYSDALKAGEIASLTAQLLEKWS